MSITGVSSNNQALASFPMLSQTREDFSAMVTALKTGDLSGAKDAFSALQQDVESIRNKITDAGLTPYFGTRPAEDLQAIHDALESGDVQEAKKAFHTLMQDLRQIRRHQAILYHHRHAGENDGSPGAATGMENTDSASGSINVTA